MSSKLQKLRRKLEQNKVSGIGNRDKLRAEFFAEYKKVKNETVSGRKN